MVNVVNEFTALVLGCNGQTGSYLCERLLAKGRTVHGMVRHSSNPNQLWRIKPLLDRITLHEGDLTDYSSLENIVNSIEPDEVYNLADQDSVAYSSITPLYTVQVTYGGVANLLEVVRKNCPKARVFQPISATVFRPAPRQGSTELLPINEKSELDPQSPYATAKAAAWYLCRYYRRKHGLFVACALPCNHDSPRRNSGYLLGKLVKEAALVASGKLEAITVGSLDLRVDIGYAMEFAEAYTRMLELPEPTDLVLGTGVGVLINDLVGAALQMAGVPNPQSAELRRVDQSVNCNRLIQLVADSAKAVHYINWRPKYDAIKVLELIRQSSQGTFQGEAP